MTRSGILLIDKPPGFSSAQIVRRVKALLGARRVGHLGTLDPFASGLLPLAINEGTKIAEIFLNGTKTYHGVMTLGVETDTQDSTGKVLQTRPVPSLGEAELEAMEERFTGALRQIPPMFSALKKDGVRLYQLARQGKEVERPPRDIRIEMLRLRQLNAAEIEFDVTCSRGTYVRALAADVGATLGCGAHLKSLRRLRCDHLSVEGAITPDQLELCKSEAEVPLIALQIALGHIRAITLEDRDVSRLRLGQQEPLSRIDGPRMGEKLVQIQDAAGNLVALVEWNEGLLGGRWQLFRIFNV